MSALMTEPVASTIVALDESGGATLTELARATGRPVSTMQRVVEGLLKAEVVVRPFPRGMIRFTDSAPRRALRELAEWRLGAHRRPDALTAAHTQMLADRAELRRLLAMDDREREAYFLASNRNMLLMFAEAQPPG